MPVNRYDYVQESATVQSPVAVQRFSERQIITRVAVGNAAPNTGGAAGQVAAGGDPFAAPATGANAVGGVAKLPDAPQTARKNSTALAR